MKVSTSLPNMEIKMTLRHQKENSSLNYAVRSNLGKVNLSIIFDFLVCKIRIINMQGIVRITLYIYIIYTHTDYIYNCNYIVIVHYIYIKYTIYIISIVDLHIYQLLNKYVLLLWISGYKLFLGYLIYPCVLSIVFRLLKMLKISLQNGKKLC